MSIETVNLHVWPKCNLACLYCYGTFPSRPKPLPFDAWARIIDELAALGVRRVTFSGGEPTLHPALLRMLVHARAVGLQTSIITNGARLDDAMLDTLDLVGLTVDSACTRTLGLLGRGPRYLDLARTVARRAHAAGAKLKVNTVVCSLNVDEDMGPLILELSPAKWKPLEFTFVPGEHGEAEHALEIGRDRFESFVDRHRALERAGVWVAPETADTVRTTYAMVDPEGRLFQHGPAGHLMSLPISTIGFERALQSVGGYDRTAFLARGGEVDVRRLSLLPGGRS